MTLLSTTPFTAELCSDCAGRACGVCGSLPEDLLARLSTAAEETSYAANQRIPGHDGNGSPVLLVRAGLLRGQRYAQNGRRQILMLAGPGDYLDPATSCTRDCELETVTPATVCRIDRPTFERIRREEGVLRRALAKQSLDWLEKTRRLTWILALPVGERLRATLLMSRRAMPVESAPDGSMILTMVLPRADLADLLATTPETISRLLHQFDDQGLIEILDPNRFRLRDIEGLSAGLAV